MCSTMGYEMLSVSMAESSLHQTRAADTSLFVTVLCVSLRSRCGAGSQ